MAGEGFSARMAMDAYGTCQERGGNPSRMKSILQFCVKDLMIHNEVPVGGTIEEGPKG